MLGDEVMDAVATDWPRLADDGRGEPWGDRDVAWLLRKEVGDALFEVEIIGDVFNIVCRAASSWAASVFLVRAGTMQRPWREISHTPTSLNDELAADYSQRYYSPAAAAPRRIKQQLFAIFLFGSPGSVRLCRRRGALTVGKAGFRGGTVVRNGVRRVSVGCTYSRGSSSIGTALVFVKI